MELLVYAVRCMFVLAFTWLCIRVIGKKNMSQLTPYELAVMLILANVASEPLVFKVTTKAFLGVCIISVAAAVISRLSANKKTNVFDSKPEIVIANSKVNKEVLGRSGINLPYLLSLLRLQGYSKVADIEFAIIEPNGNISIVPKSQGKPVNINEKGRNIKYVGLSLPLIIDGLVQYENLNYASLSMDWLNYEIRKYGAKDFDDVFLAELDTEGELQINLYDNEDNVAAGMFQ